MKTRTIILFATICFSFGFCNCTNSQNSTNPKERFIERSMNGQTYVFDKLNRTIQNKKNHIYKVVESHHCDYSVDMIKPYDEIFDKIFSAERKKELKGKTLPMFFYCDSSGNILEISFKVKDISMLTLQEVNALENAFFKYKFEIRNSCPENKYYFVMTGYRGWL